MLRNKSKLYVYCTLRNNLYLYFIKHSPHTKMFQIKVAELNERRMR